MFPNSQAQLHFILLNNYSSMITEPVFQPVLATSVATTLSAYPQYVWATAQQA